MRRDIDDQRPRTKQPEKSTCQEARHSHRSTHCAGVQGAEGIEKKLEELRGDQDGPLKEKRRRRDKFNEFRMRRHRRST